MKPSLFLLPALLVSSVAYAQQQSVGMGSNSIDILQVAHVAATNREPFQTTNDKKEIRFIDCWIEPIHTLNSDFPEYTPVIAHNVRTMFFTGRRKDNVGNKRTVDPKYKAEDIYYSVKDARGVWGEEIPVPGKINSARNEAITWISADGKKMILCQDEDLYEAVFENGEWTKPEPMKALNSMYRETHASYSADGNTIFFTTDNPQYASVGGLDICMIKKDNSSGEWGKPQLVNGINSSLNEEDPTLLPDGKTFYFSSQGFSSLGGYDIFKSTFDKGSFSAPENVGFPINTVSNEPFISFSDDNSRAFLSSDRGDKNEQNLYEVIFPEFLKLPLLVEVYDMDTKELLNSNASLVNVTSKQPFYLDNATRGIFSGQDLGMNTQYTLQVNAEGHTSQEVTINTTGIGPFDPDTFRLVQKVYLSSEKKEDPIPADLMDSKVYFDYASFKLKPKAVHTLESVKQFMETHPNAQVIISAHTDSRGTNESNVILSDNRGEKVIQWLISNGIDASRITMTSHGEEKPYTDNNTEDNRSMNRRVEIRMIMKQ